MIERQESLKRDAKEWHEEEENKGEGWKQAWDDVAGKMLDPRRVREARREEIRYTEKMKVRKKIPIKTAERYGWKVIATRWIDVDKGDQDNPNYRSRLVGKEFNNGIEMGLFA